MFVDEETRKQTELISSANKPFLCPEHPQSSGFFLACQSSQRHLEKIKLSTTLLPPIYPVSLPAYPKDDGYLTGRTGVIMRLLYF